MVAEFVEILLTIEQANDYFDRVCQLRRPNGKPLNQRQVGDLLDVTKVRSRAIRGIEKLVRI